MEDEIPKHIKRKKSNVSSSKSKSNHKHTYVNELFINEDEKVYKYCCEPDCIYAGNPYCKGHLIVGVKNRRNAKKVKICPYYVEEDK